MFQFHSELWLSDIDIGDGDTFESGSAWVIHSPMDARTSICWFTSGTSSIPLPQLNMHCSLADI